MGNQEIFAALARLERMEKQSGPKSFEEFERERDGKKPQGSVGHGESSMIYSLTVKCVQGPEPIEPVSRVIEIEDRSTLLDLHGAIQSAFHLDPDHLFEFFVGRSERKEAIVFTQSDDWEDMAEAFGSIELNRLWPVPKNMKLFYWYDFGDDWKFQITKGRSEKRPKEGVSYPRAV